MATKAVKPIPDGYHSVTPYIVCKGAAKAIDWYRNVFGAEELMRMEGAPGTIAHAEIKIADSVVMMADEHPDMGARSPEAFGGTPVGFMIYLKDCDAVFKKAVDAGAKADRPLADQFYGDRSGSVIDPFGHKWTIATHIEDIPPEEMGKRHDEWMAKQKK